ncbi:hypothetical protein BRYFOR_07384 [Marvinbryantia formatexigens DSM 14469]|uniref:Glycosyltransferase 2-like domain-containing protein n=1 Tax=Marvinbryantia formatexigens DSM 14469 TaxID=478749 RepID=C6LFI1_9FIRM|nr:glycosyltransferase family A protein [Marvinbryantia formatexigens]EET60566.1 hypothetical protein BRYFOR_07384 [Marvinbryantia formatexigens DSM 14469]SDG19757.1 Glycosyl transferase family 2 [Marvinbryantia formatexigens]
MNSKVEYKKNMESVNHSFVICAYKESPYLEECILSLKKQTVKSNIIVVTSTPNSYIENLAAKYHLPYYINTGEGGITQDWNFGYACAKTKYITIAHQDDVYHKDYLATALRMCQDAKKPLIFFSNYYEIREGKPVVKNRLLTIKRIMLLPLCIRIFWKSRWVRRRILSLGSPICCPSVMFVTEHLPEVIFKNGFRACEDWEAWETLSKLPGEFVYSPQMLMGHRIHEDSETSAIIGDNKRSDEEYQMFCKFWPETVAKLILKFYAKGQDSNQL